MSRFVRFVLFIYLFGGICGSSTAKSKKDEQITFAPLDLKVAQQCGVSMQVPRLLNVFDQPISFGCSGTYINGNAAILSMYFAYDPNQGSGGSNIGFEIQGIGIFEKMEIHGDSVFQNSSSQSQPILSKDISYGVSNCGTPAKINITSISGGNWHGWIAEESFGKAQRGCKLTKEYTSAYRCVHLMIGNEKMVAQLGGVCLLRKREYSLENGYSYDLFIDMIKSIRFNEN